MTMAPWHFIPDSRPAKLPWGRWGLTAAACAARQFDAVDAFMWGQLLSHWAVHELSCLRGTQNLAVTHECTTPPPVLRCPAGHLDVPHLALARRPWRQVLIRHQGVYTGHPCYMAWCRAGHGPYRYVPIAPPWTLITPNWTWAHPSWSARHHEARARRYDLDALLAPEHGRKTTKERLVSLATKARRRAARGDL